MHEPSGCAAGVTVWEYTSKEKLESDGREQMIKQNMPLVGFVTSRFLGRGHEYEDLYQYGCIGLIKAVDRFDPSYGVTFSTYAVPLIIGEIKRFLRGDGSVHVSRTIRENAVKVIRAIDDYEKSGNRATVENICEKTGLEKHETVLAMSAMHPVRSLYEPVSGDGEIQLKDILGTDDGEKLTDNIAVQQAMSTLDRNERELIHRRYFMKQTQTAIAADLGMTQVQISRLEKKILLKLRELLM